MNPRFPVYIISKGRWESRLTAKALTLRNVPFRIVVEPQEYEQYAAVIPAVKILTLPFSNLGQGSIPARNWIWEHSLAEGHTRHWILDDNLRRFLRLTNNLKCVTSDGASFCAIEDFIERYENVALAGMQYGFFAPRKKKIYAFIPNTRIYSCILVKNDIPYRWRGRYNEDTDLSLRVLKDGWCTILFNAFLCEKMTTMTMKGGNTDALYQKDGRLQMALSLQRQHPDVVCVDTRWGRYQHVVNYRPFAGNKLRLKPGFDRSRIPAHNEYGMILPEKSLAQ